MAQHPLIQVRINTYNNTQKLETCVDRMLGRLRRQALGSRQTHYFRVYRLAEPTLPPGTMRCRDFPRGPIAWRTYPCRQALYQ